MHKRKAVYGIVALIAAACIFSACPTGDDDPDPDPTPNPVLPDTTAPVLQGLTANGFEVVLTYNEVLDGTSVPADTDFTLVNLSGGIDSVAISGRRVILTLDASADDSETGITLDYTADADPIKDSAGNKAADFTTEDVTNVTLAEPTYDGSADSDDEFEVTSAAGSSTGETKLTFTWFSTGGYTLQYTLTADSGDVAADAVWTNAPASGTPTGDITPGASTDDVWVRFIDPATGNVSAPAEDTALVTITVQG
jgi:hypothetical protein